MSEEKGLFSEAEIQILVSALGDDVTEKDAIKFVDWCTLTRVRMSILNHILEGTTLATLRKNGEPKFWRHKTPEEIEELDILLETILDEETKKNGQTQDTA